MMTREQIADIMRMLMASLRMQRPVLDDKLLLDGWAFALHDLPLEPVMRAAALVLREDKYFPEPSRIRELALQETLGLPDIDQAWTIITDAIHHHGRERWVSLPAPARDALGEAVDALGGLYTLRHSERPERDRDQFYRLWPEIRQRYLRAGMARAPSSALMPPPELVPTHALPPGVLAIEHPTKGLQLYRVPGEHEAAAWKEENYAGVTPRPVPRAILGAPPSRAESRDAARAELDPDGTGGQE